MFNGFFSKNNIDKNEPSANLNKEKRAIPTSINDIKVLLNKDFSNCSDFIIRDIVTGKQEKTIIISYIDGFVNKQILSQNVVDPILKHSENTSVLSGELLRNKIISSCSLSVVKTFDESLDAIVSGEAVIFIDGENTAYIIGVKAPDKRAVEEASMEITIKGSREGFTESLRTNTVLLRRRIKNPQFKIESMRLGKETNSEVAICYIEGIVDNEILKEVKSKVSNIRIDGLMGSGYIEQFIQDGRFPLFPLVGNSEKPDKVAAKLLEGRVAIIVDGTPTVLTVPFLFIETIQIQEDYFGDFFFASFMRLLRFSSFIISVYLPAMYVAITSFHQTIIPFKLMITMAASREGIPFSSFVESLFMILTFEVLREAGIRMPRAIGQAVSIVGAIVLGDAAVTAGVASAPVIIVVALSGICSFIIPPLMKVEAILRIAMLIAANIVGLLGVAVLSIVVLTYLCDKRSFGVPYLTPFAPLNISGLKDSLIVVPIWAMFTRPNAFTKGHDITRTTGKQRQKG